MSFLYSLYHPSKNRNGIQIEKLSRASNTRVPKPHESDQILNYNSQQYIQNKKTNRTTIDQSVHGCCFKNSEIRIEIRCVGVTEETGTKPLCTWLSWIEFQHFYHVFLCTYIFTPISIHWSYHNIMLSLLSLLLPSFLAIPQIHTLHNGCSHQPFCFVKF